MGSIYEEVLGAIHSVWHRRWLALGVAWAICLLGWLVVALIPNSYESQARIFIQLDDPLAQQVGIDVADRKRDIERIRQTLTSAVKLEKIVRSTELGRHIDSPKAMEAAVLKLGTNIKVVGEQENLFQITALSKDSSFSDAENARVAQQIAQKLIDIFREENLYGNRGTMVETIEFVNGQLAQREKELEAAENRRREFEQAHPEMGRGGASSSARLDAARSEMRGVEADLVAAQSALAAMNGQLSSTPRSLAGAAGGAGALLASAESNLAGMRARGLTENHPDVIAARNQVAAYKPAAARETANGTGVPNPAYSSLESLRADRQATVQSLSARRAGLQAEVAQLTALALDNPGAVAESQKIDRDYSVLKEQYDKLLQDREELRLRGEIKTGREALKFEVVDPPTTPRAPVAPNRPLLLLGVLLAGFGGGAGAAFGMAKLRSTFATTAGLERTTGLPVLGAISYNLTDSARRLRAKRLKLWFAGTAALGGLFVLLLAVEFIQRGMVA